MNEVDCLAELRGLQEVGDEAGDLPLEYLRPPAHRPVEGDGPFDDSEVGPWWRSAAGDREQAAAGGDSGAPSWS
jgi:hypothetical protein